MVTYSDDESPEFQVADDASSALEDVLSRVRELNIQVSENPRSDLDCECPDFGDFCQKYTLLDNSFDSSAALNGCAFGWTGGEWEVVRNAQVETLWTIVESEGLWWISPGLHYVNRLGYLLTKEARQSDERHYIYD